MKMESFDSDEQHDDGVTPSSAAKEPQSQLESPFPNSGRAPASFELPKLDNLKHGGKNQMVTPGMPSNFNLPPIGQLDQNSSSLPPLPPVGKMTFASPKKKQFAALEPIEEHPN